MLKLVYLGFQPLFCVVVSFALGHTQALLPHFPDLVVKPLFLRYHVSLQFFYLLFKLLFHVLKPLLTLLGFYNAVGFFHVKVVLAA